MKHRLLFVCTGNICRSPLAHRVFEHIAKEHKAEEHFSVASAGTHSWHQGEEADPRMRKTSTDHGIPFSHLSRALKESDFDFYSYLFAMDHGHLAIMKSLNKERAQVYLFRNFDPEGNGNVPDPYYGGAEGFEEVYDIVYRTCKNIFDTFEKNNFEFL